MDGNGVSLQRWQLSACWILAKELGSYLYLLTVTSLIYLLRRPIVWGIKETQYICSHLSDIIAGNWDTVCLPISQLPQFVKWSLLWLSRVFKTAPRWQQWNRGGEMMVAAFKGGADRCHSAGVPMRVSAPALGLLHTGRAQRNAFGSLLHCRSNSHIY